MRDECKVGGRVAVKHLKNAKRPLVLTINGKAEAVVRDAGAYQRLLDIAAQVDPSEGIRQGLEDVKKGRVRRLWKRSDTPMQSPVSAAVPPSRFGAKSNRDSQRTGR
jgi:hypothetical protein